MKQVYFKEYLKFIDSCPDNSHFIIFDLDNTLAHTYPFLGAPNTSQMYRTLPPHENMLNVAKEAFNSDAVCLVLTAREYKYKSATEYWLNNHIKHEHIPLFIVPKAKDKMDYIELAISKFDQVIYYDDLSYNHENGEVKFYQDEISKLKTLKLTYFGYDEITKINTVKDV